MQATPLTGRVNAHPPAANTTSLPAARSVRPGPSLMGLLGTALLAESPRRGVQKRVFPWDQAPGLEVREWVCTGSVCPSGLTMEVDAWDKGGRSLAERNAPGDGRARVLR